MAEEHVYFDAGFYLVPDGRMFSMIVHNDVEVLYATGFGGSSTYAEWISAITALQFALEHGMTEVTFFGDNENVIDAMTNIKVAHKEQIGLMARAKELDALIKKSTWKHVLSPRNPAGRAIKRSRPLLSDKVVQWNP